MLYIKEYLPPYPGQAITFYFGSGMSDQQTALHWLAQQAPHMRQKLIAWAQICSGSGHIPGLQAMGAALIEAFDGLPVTAQHIDLKPHQQLSDQGQWQAVPLGQALYWQCRPGARQRVLLVGHMDTVFGPEHSFQKVSDEGEIIKGPGVSDMKGGLLVMLYALLAWEQQAEHAKLGWDVLITPDEELGSPQSRDILAKLGPEHSMALVFEPAMNSKGTLVSTRKGSGKFTLTAKGQAAHVGRAFAQGVNAICAMAQMVNQIHNWNRERCSIIINVGTIHGGDAVNRVADFCLCRLDVRTDDEADCQWFRERMQNLMDEFNQQQGLSVELHGDFGRPAKPWTEKTEKAFSLLEKAGKKLGITIEHQATGGCCDGNNLSTWCGVIDTLGVCGGGIHSQDEFVQASSLVTRAQLTFQWLCEWSKE